MTPNATYIARTNFRTVDRNDQQIAFEAGVLLFAEKFDTLVCPLTGEVFDLPLHVARNPSWYFHKVGDMGHPSIGPKVTHEDYVREVVRGNEGLLGSCYFELVNLEGWLPCEKSALNNSFTATLSRLGFEMRHNGQVVTGIKHHKKDCTYHVKKNAKRVDGWAA